MKRGLLTLVVFVNIFTSGFGQSEVVDFLKFGKADANKLVEAYLNPYANALGDGLNNSWYNTAETHKRWGFDFSMSVSAVSIPNSDKTFDINALGLTNSVVASGNGNIAPTAAGKNEAGPLLDLYLNPNDETTYQTSFHTPSGAGLDIVPVPMFQLTFGLLPHTDVIGRYIPTIKFSSGDDDGKVGLVGIGLKHNFKEWVPFMKKLPFDASVFVGYSNITAESGVTFTLENYGIAPGTVNYVADDNQMLKVKTNSLKYGLIVSKKVSVLTVFASVANSSSKSNVDIIGRYPLVTIQGGDIIVNEEIDPVALSFDASDVSMTAGLRLKFGFFSLFGSINKSHYTSYNAGLAFGFR